MRLKLPNVLEVDSTMQQLSAVVAGLGWSITTPLCLASHPDLLDQMVIFPMPRAQFRRRIQLVARRGEFGDLPREIAAHARAILRTSRVGALAQHYPWLSSSVEWPEESAALAS